MWWRFVRGIMTGYRPLPGHLGRFYKHNNKISPIKIHFSMKLNKTISYSIYRKSYDHNQSWRKISNILRSGTQVCIIREILSA